MQRNDPKPLLGGQVELRTRIQVLSGELADCQDLVEAIRRGDIDAIVVSDRRGEHRVYTLETADRPYRFLIEQMQEGAVTLSEDGTVLYCNQRVANMLGVPQERIIGQRLVRFLLPQDAPSFSQLLDEAKRFGARGELTFRRSDASDIPVYVSVSRLLSGETVLLCGILTDLTEQKLHLREVADANVRLVNEIGERERVEDALRQAQKMRAIGELTAGIAHDFNNMLQAIGGSLELTQRRIEQSRAAEAGQYVESARQAVARAAALTNRLLGFGRRQALHPRPVDPDGLVEGTQKLVRATVGPEITVESHLNGGQWSLLCDQNQLENALLNVAINARDAMPQGGRLTISTKHVRLGEWDDAGQDGVKPGDYMEIAIADTGTGMDEATRSRAFEPFFTTRPMGQGTGLGLSQLYGFVRQSGGLVRLESKPGQGTTVRLYMPGHRKAPAQVAGQAQGHNPAPATDPARSVLLVEDEPNVRSVAAEWLRELGYRVLEAEDGPAALDLLDRTDHFRDACDRCGIAQWPQWPPGRRRRPRTPAGAAGAIHYGDTGSILVDQLEAGMQVLGKPFTLDMLAARVGAMLVTYASTPSATAPTGSLGLSEATAERRPPPAHQY